MAEAVEEAKKMIKQIGEQLANYKTRPNKSILVKLLKQATSAFPELTPSESLKDLVKPLSDSIIKHGLLDHQDKDIRLLVGICLCEVLRVLAPNPGFSNAVSRDIFRFLVSMFGELDDIASPYFSRRAKVLETIAKLKFCLLMLDTGCEDLVFKMFKSFFSVVREDHPQSLINSMSSIIISILEEKLEAAPDPLEHTSQSLFDVILHNIVREKKDVASPFMRLAVSVIQNCGQKMEHYICQFLKSCILDRDAVESVIKESYHEIVLEIYQISPQLLLSVIPCLTHELLSNQVDVRIKALNLTKKFLALHGQHFTQEYPHIFIELLNRFSDKSAEVRLAALSCAKALYMTNPSGKASVTILSAIQDRLLDHDDKVRTEAVNVVCELCKTNLNLTSSDLISQAAERLRDKKVLVRSRALKSLVELYQEYCTRFALGITSLNEHIEEIPCKVLMLCFEKDCQEFKPQSMELLLAELFPSSLSIEERTRHWILMFSLFSPLHLKALRTILSLKRRLQAWLKDYLDLWNRAEDSSCGEAERKMEALVVKMSSCFPDPAKAKDRFQKVKALKDNGIQSVLRQFLKEGTIYDSETTKDVYLRELGDQKALTEFLHLLSKKCSFNIFSSEHVQYILNCLSGDEDEKKHLKKYQVQLLLTIIGAFPSLLKGSEKQFQLLLLEKEIPFNEQLVEILAREGYHISIKLSDIYSSLEKVCLEGTRALAKLSVSAIAALADTSEQFMFSKLCKTLVSSLHKGHNAPTVLQSLGCLAQHSISTFEGQEKVITHYIIEEILRRNDVPASKDLDIFDDRSNCCSSCKLKVFGLKALVRSYLPHKHSSLGRPISLLLDIILQMLQQCAFSAGSIPCEYDKAFIRLAAAKSVLRLSRKWDLHISPVIFRLTVSVAKENSPEIRRLFARKIHKLLSRHAVPSRYACAFSFVALDCLEDLRSDALKYLEEFIREYNKGAQIHEITTMQGAASHPVYLVVFLIHVLAHDPNFPAPHCRDEKTYAQFLSPLFVTVQALVNENLGHSNLILNSSALLYLRSIFNAIKRTEDAVDDQITPKLHLLAEAGICILNSLSTNNIFVPQAPGLILLPSSLYKSGPSKMIEANAYPSIGSKADVRFTEGLVSYLKSEVSGARIGNAGTKLRPSGSRKGKSNSKSGYPDDLSIDKTKDQIVNLQTGQKEQIDASNSYVKTRGQQDPATSSHLGSVVFNNKFSAANKHEGDAHRNLGAKATFPCDSASIKPSLSQSEAIIRYSSEENIINKCSSISAEPSKLSRASNQSIQNTNSNGEALIGKHIKLWSPIEKCYYLGVVDSFDSTTTTHQITYETGDIDILSLDSETWEIVDKQKNLLSRKDICVTKVSQAVKRTKECEDAIGTSTSEVIDMSGNDVRPTRRQKV